jgi:hypothetical protein
MHTGRTATGTSSAKPPPGPLHDQPTSTINSTNLPMAARSDPIFGIEVRPCTPPPVLTPTAGTPSDYDSAARASSSRITDPAGKFSSRWASDAVPGISNVLGAIVST